MADLIFQGISSDTNRMARVWQRPMRSPTSHARIAIFTSESAILTKTVSEEISKIADRDIPFAKVLEHIQSACAQISDGDIGLLIGESDGDTLTFHAHGPIRCYLAEPMNDSFQVTPLPVETYARNEPFSYVTGQVGSGIFIACTENTERATEVSEMASMAVQEDGLWQLKRKLETNADISFCVVIGKSGRAVPGAVVTAAEPETLAAAFNAAATEVEKADDVFAPVASLNEALEDMQDWAKDTRAQFKKSVTQASTFDPRSFFRKMGSAFVAGKSTGSSGNDASVAGERSSRAKNFWRNAVNRFLSLPRNFQIASAGLMVCVILFFISLGVAPLLGYGKANAATDRELVAISSLIDDAQSNLIYKNEDRATTLVKEADTRLNALLSDKPLVKNKDIARRQNELAGRISSMRTDLRHAVAIHPESQTLTTEATNVVGIGNLLKELYAAKGTDLLRFNQTQKTFEVIATLPNAIDSVIIDDQDQLVVMRLSDGSLVAYTLKTKKIEPALPLPSTFNMIAAYGGRYYGLDAARGVVRITDTTVNPWLKSPGAAPDPRGIAVDGDVYAATASEIKKYRTGNPVAFTVSAIDPTLSNIKTINTSAESSFLYVLDQGGNRLLALNKTGKLAKQYELPPGQTAQTMTVSETNKTAYLLVGSTIITVPLTHL